MSKKSGQILRDVCDDVLKEYYSISVESALALTVLDLSLIWRSHSRIKIVMKENNIRLTS